MGSCVSTIIGPTTPEAQRDRKIQKNLDKDKTVAKNTRKILLLGAGESGKSTVFKQMKRAYLKRKPDDSTNKTRRFEIIQYLVGGAQDFFKLLQKSNEPFLEGFLANPTYAKALEEVLQGSHRHPEIIRTSFPTFAQNLETLWSVPDVKAFWATVWPSASGVSESWEKFADDCVNNWKHKDPAKKWGSSSWIPTEEDEMLTRIRTVGVNKQVFTDLEGNNGHYLEVIDVGGQRNERGKWLKVFSDTHAVLYVAAISGYNQNLYEEKNVNRLLESFRLFESLLQEEAFNRPNEPGTDFILFLNKCDLFEKKLIELRIPVNQTGLFPTAPSGEQEFDLAANLMWMEQSYQTIFKERRPEHTLHIHQTTATNADENLMRVFEFVKKQVFNILLEAFGFL